MSSFALAPASVSALTSLALPVYALPPSGKPPLPISVSPRLLTNDEANDPSDTTWPMGANILNTAGQFVLAPMPINPSPYSPLNPIPFPVNPPLYPVNPTPQVLTPVSQGFVNLNPPPMPLNSPFNPLGSPYLDVGPLTKAAVALQDPLVGAAHAGPILAAGLPKGVTEPKWEVWIDGHKKEAAVLAVLLVVFVVWVARRRHMGQRMPF